MGVEGEPPTQEEIQEIRSLVARRASESASDELDLEALSRIQNDDNYVTKFFKHVFDHPGVQVEATSKMIMHSLIWRKEFGTKDIQESDFTQALLEKGALFARNRDKDGRKLLIFCVGKHVKGEVKMEDMKKFFVYYLERLGREDNGEQFSIVFDCRNGGLKNMDMEFMQFMIGVMKDFYPDPLNYILVFEMPWVLNAAFKIIKAWLPPPAVKKIKFLTKSNMSEYVDDENRLEAWGGLDTWEYKWEPESSALANGHKEEARKKTVTFAGSNLVVSPSAESLGSAVSSSSGMGGSGQPGGQDLLRLSPAQEVMFSSSPMGDLTGKVTLYNNSGRPLGYKIKTTSPEKYRVRPSTGCLPPGQDATVEIHVSSSQAKEAGSLLRDKFLVTAVLLDREDLPPPQLAEALKTQTPDGQYRLRCQLAGSLGDSGQVLSPSMYSSPGGMAPPTQTEDPVRQVANIGRKVTQLVAGQEQVSAQLRQIHLLLVITICLLVTLIFLVFFYQSECPSAMQPINQGQSVVESPDLEEPIKSEL